MAKKSSSGESIWYEAMFLVALIAITYFLFQLLLIFSAVSLRGCLYEFWSSDGLSILSLHGMFVAVVGALLIWSLLRLVRALSARNHVGWYAAAVFYSVATVVLAL